MTPLQIPWRTECIHFDLNTEQREKRIFNSNSHYFGFEFRFCARLLLLRQFWLKCAEKSTSILAKHERQEKRWKNHASRITATVLAAATATQHTINQQQQNDDNRQILNLHGNFIRAKRTENDFLNEATGNEEMKAWKVNENKHENPKKAHEWNRLKASNRICCSLKWSLQLFFLLNADKIMNRLRHYLFACSKIVSHGLYRTFTCMSVCQKNSLCNVIVNEDGRNFRSLPSSSVFVVIVIGAAATAAITTTNNNTTLNMVLFLPLSGIAHRMVRSHRK